MSAVNAWSSRVETELAYRRRHAFKLTIEETQLRSFARFADQIGTAEPLRVALAVAWARILWALKSAHLGAASKFCVATHALVCARIR